LRTKKGEEGEPITPCKMIFDTSCLETDAKMMDVSGLTSSSQNANFSRKIPNQKLEVKCSEID
jgi:hypothetical protein